MKKQKINIIIAGRAYPLTIPMEEEETIRKVGKQINDMIKDFQANYDIQDKQDALAMCALTLGTNAERELLKSEQNIKSSNERLMAINQLIEDLEQ